MEFFNKAKAIRLKTHSGKYLIADDDEETVRQSRNNASSRRARWTVELVEGNSHLVRLKSCHRKYLTASDQPMLLGMTGNKVVQQVCDTKNKMEASILWEPIKEGMFQVKLRTKFGGKFLRANGGTPPWRNSITHDFPHRTMTQDWVLWSIEVVDISVCDFDSSSGDYGSTVSRFSDVADDFLGSEKESPKMMSSKSSQCFVEVESKMGLSFESIHSSNEVGTQMVPYFKSIHHNSKKESGMELFHNAKSIRLRSRHDKYLLADEDEESVCQDRNGSCKNARWTVEFVENRSNILRLKSCFGKYLTATDVAYPMAGKKVLQTSPSRLDSSVEWEPIREGFQVRLKTRYGNFLRANNGVPPWRNSITHDIPHRTATQDWVLWDVDVVEIRPRSPSRRMEESVRRSNVVDSDESEPDSPVSTTKSKLKFSESMTSSMVKREGRVIYYSIISDESEKVDEAIEGPSFKFMGKGVEELKQKLIEEIGIENFAVCSRNPLNGKLYPLKLHLPPNNVTMHVVIVPSSSK